MVERLVYTERAGGSNPSLPKFLMRQKNFFKDNFFYSTFLYYFQSNFFMLFSRFIIPYLFYWWWAFFVVTFKIGLLTIICDFKQGKHVHIIFTHVPFAWVSLIIYMILTLLAITFFISKSQIIIYLAKALAPSGLLLIFITLITGGFWSAPTWGKFWAWDIRLISVLILLIIYFIYVFLIYAFEDNIDVLLYSNLMLILGVLDVPVVKFCVYWWGTIHQISSMNPNKGLIYRFLLLLLACFLILISLSTLIFFFLNIRLQLILKKKKNLQMVISKLQKI